MKSSNMRARRFGIVLLLLAAGLAADSTASVGAEEHEPIPGSCKVHHTKVVNPGCVPSLTEDVREPGITLPNLVPNVTDVFISNQWFFNPENNTFTPGPPELWFDTWAQNFGTVPVDILADDPLSPDGGTVSQCVSWTADYLCRERAAAGGFSWHQEHEHFHFNDFADYEFRHVTADGAIDHSDAGLIALSDKVSFCLMDSQKADPDSLSVPTYRTCGNTRQGVTPGYTDIYGAALPGQQFPIENVPDGRYALVIDMNTTGVMLETDYTDNRVEAIFDISKATGTVTVISTTWP